MNYKEHLKVGLILEFVTILIIGVCIYYFSLPFTFSYILVILILITIFISPLAPDLDHYNGKLREILVGLGLAIATYGVFVEEVFIKRGLFFAMIPYVIPYLTSHRGITHSLLFNVIYGGILYYLTQNIYVAIVGFVGFYSHLWTDNIPFKPV